MRSYLIALTVFLFVFINQSEAQVVPIERFALLIGNADYNEDGKYSPTKPIAGLRDLKNPCNDVQAIGAKLQLSGWPEESIDIRCNLQISEMHGAISRFVERFQASDEPMALLYFSGHGAQVQNKNYFFGVGANPDVAKVARILAKDAGATLFLRDAIDLSAKVVREVGDVTSGALLIFIDACRDNPLVNELAAIRKVSVSSLISPLQLLPGIVLAYSTGDGSLADDGIGETSPFAQAVIDGVSEYAYLDDIINEAITAVSDSTRGFSWQQIPDRRGAFRQPPKRCLGPCAPAQLRAAREYVPLLASLSTNGVQDIALTYALSQARTDFDRNTEALPAKAVPNRQVTRTLYEDKAPKASEKTVYLDVFWCSGDEKSEERLRLASQIAATATALAKTSRNNSGSTLARVRTRALPYEVNEQPEYFASDVIIEVSPTDKSGTEWADLIASASTMPIRRTSGRTRGVAGYIKAYVCNDTTLPTEYRLFIQVSRATQEPLARKLLTGLEQRFSSLRIAAGIDVRPVDAPGSTELRYYFLEDRPLALKLAEETERRLNTPVAVRESSRPSSIVPGAVELWVGEDWFPEVKKSAELNSATKSCRAPENGVERWGSFEEVSRSSSWRGGGYSQSSYCTELIAELKSEYRDNDIVIDVTSSREAHRDSCSPFRCIQYQYTCVVNVKRRPIFREAKSDRCELVGK